MSSLHTIEFNYEKALRQAGELDDIAVRLENLSNKSFQGLMQDLSGAWQSDHSKEYIDKCNKVAGDIVTTSDNLTRIAQAIRNVAEVIHEAELEAWRIAHERDS